MGTGLEHSKWGPSCGTAYEQYSQNLYTFFIETTGALRPEELFLRSIEILKNKLLKLKLDS